MTPPAAPGTDVVRTAQALAIDRVTAEVVGAFNERAIGTILLKGPTIATWLYPEGGRSYGDTDLLVEPTRFEDAEAVLCRLRFTRCQRGPAHAILYYRVDQRSGTAFKIDLHHTLPYVRAPAAHVWEVLAERLVAVTVAGSTVSALDIPARAFHVALHAVQHGPDRNQSMEDLHRAIATVGPHQWPGAVVLAKRLGGEDCLAAGLRLMPEGTLLAAELGLCDTSRMALRFGCHPRAGGVQVLQRLATARTWRDKIGLLREVLVPYPEVMRRTTPLARGGQVGLGLAYLSRLLRLARWSGPALHTWYQLRVAPSGRGQPHGSHE